LHQLKLIAASRVSAARTTSRQQVTDIVKVTVDDEVDTRTFRAIVDDVAGDALR
jgi:acetyl-CoA carboxylase alpha subunit